MKAGWQVRKFGEVCELKKGKKPALSAAPDNGYKPYLVAKFLRGAEPVEFASVSDKYSISVGQNEIIIICDGSNSGETFMGFDGILSSTMAKVAHGAELDNKFLMHFLDSLFEQFNAGKTGSAIPHLDLPALRDQNLPLPPLPEQQRIVGILDEAFDGITTAKTNAEQNLQNARALFESHLQSVFTQRGEGWEEKPFEELIESNVIGLTKNSREQGEDKAYPYVKMNNITRDNHFDFSSFTCVEATDEEVSKFSLRDGDFLFNTRNSYELVGKSCIYESDSDAPVLFNNNIMRVRFKSGIEARFVLLALTSKVVADELNSLKSGTTNVSAIYFKDLKFLKIPIPSIDMQKTIAAKLELLSEETQRLESLYQRKLAALDELKKSLLHQAFSGVL